MNQALVRCVVQAGCDKCRNVFISALTETRLNLCNNVANNRVSLLCLCVRIICTLSSAHHLGNGPRCIGDSQMHLPLCVFKDKVERAEIFFCNRKKKKKPQTQLNTTQHHRVLFLYVRCSEVQCFCLDGALQAASELQKRHWMFIHCRHNWGKLIASHAITSQIEWAAPFPILCWGLWFWSGFTQPVQRFNPSYIPSDLRTCNNKNNSHYVWFGLLRF